jgi:hypothetical protein
MQGAGAPLPPQVFALLVPHWDVERFGNHTALQALTTRHSYQARGHPPLVQMAALTRVSKAWRTAVVHAVERERYRRVQRLAEQPGVLSAKEAAHPIESLRRGFVLHRVSYADDGVLRIERSSSYNLVWGELHLRAVSNAFKQRTVREADDKDTFDFVAPASFSSDEASVQNTFEEENVAFKLVCPAGEYATRSHVIAALQDPVTQQWHRMNGDTLVMGPTIPGFRDETLPLGTY